MPHGSKEKIVCEPNEDLIPFEYKRKVVECWNSSKAKRLKLYTVRSKCRHVKSERMLYKWASQIEQGGSPREKIRRISEQTFLKFVEAKQLRMIIHYVDLRRWALQAKDAENLTTFKAWIKALG